MRIINNQETIKVSGGTSYLQIQTRLIIEGIPPSCIENFYALYKDNFATLIPDNIESLIIQNCREMDSMSFISVETDYLPLSIKLIDI